MNPNPNPALAGASTALPQSFAYACTQWGLPLSLCTPVADASHNLTGFTAAQIARIYWMLAALEFSLTLEIEDHRVVSVYNARAEPLPHERLARVPRCAAPWGDSVSGELDLRLAFPARAAGGTHALSFTLEEKESGSAYRIGTKALGAPWTLVQRIEVAVLGRTAPLYLELGDPDLTAKITNVSVKEVFYE